MSHDTESTTHPATRLDDDDPVPGQDSPAHDTEALGTQTFSIFLISEGTGLWKSLRPMLRPTIALQLTALTLFVTPAICMSSISRAPSTRFRSWRKSSCDSNIVVAG